ncbi:MAG: YcbK family protein [Rhizobiaceae bacterium]
MRSRSTKTLVRALSAAGCLFVASCSTSPDSQASFGLTNLNVADDTGAVSVKSAEPALSSDARDSDSSLPDQVAFLPSNNPVEPAEEAAAAAQAEATAKPLPEAKSAEAEKVGEDTLKKVKAEQILTASPSPVVEQVMTARDPALDAPSEKKRGFLASLFSTNQASAAPSPALTKTEKLAATPSVKAQEKKATEKPVKLAAADAKEQAEISRAVISGSYGSDALPGVRKGALFEIKRKSGLDDNSDVDLNEDDMYPVVRVASAAGMARLAPNGLLKQTEKVDVACLKPGLVKMLRQIENHFGRKVVVTSGYRSPSYNRRVRGASRSQHMYCAAADIQVAGVTKWELANFARALPGRGGVGTYCHTESVHVDIGPERDWNWRCRRRKA